MGILCDQRGVVVAIEPSTGAACSRWSATRITSTQTESLSIRSAADKALTAHVRERGRFAAPQQGDAGPPMCPAPCSNGHGDRRYRLRGHQRLTMFENQPEGGRGRASSLRVFRHHDFPRRVQTRPPAQLLRGHGGSQKHPGTPTPGCKTGPATAMSDFAARLRILGSASRSTCRHRPASSTAGRGRSTASVTDVELANAAYGQAEVLVMPLQMCLVGVHHRQQRPAHASQAGR